MLEIAELEANRTSFGKLRFFTYFRHVVLLVECAGERCNHLGLQDEYPQDEGA